MNQSKQKPSKWSLRPGDLPTARAREREPLLHGLEHNAVFRLLMLRRRGAGLGAWRGGGGPFLRVLIILGLIVIAGPLALLYLLLLPLLRGMHRRRGHRVIGDLTESDLSDLATCPLSAADYTQALWGYSAAEAGLRRRLIVGALAAAVGLMIIGAPTPWHLIGLILLFGVAFKFAAQSGYPADRLWRLLKELGEQHRGTMGALAMGAYGCFVTLLVLIGVVMLVLGVPSLFENEDQFLPRLLMGRLTAWQWAAVVSLTTVIGALIGATIGRFQRDRLRTNKDRLLRLVETMLETWRRRGPFEGKVK